MAITMRVSEKELKLIKEFADVYGMSTSEFIRTVVMERIEDEFDLKAYEEAEAELTENPKTFTLQEVIDTYGEDKDV
ncbi:MAG: ribbon-helix-helix protein, CopG family [Clostridia bacterium]|nr:ribbon-helix-helix protein, CopG family [Clostridia bacterium]